MYLSTPQSAYFIGFKFLMKAKWISWRLGNVAISHIRVES